MGLNGLYGASRYLSALLSYGGSDSYRSIDFLFVLTKMAESPESLSMIVTLVGRYSLSLTSFVSPYLWHVLRTIWTRFVPRLLSSAPYHNIIWELRSTTRLHSTVSASSVFSETERCCFYTPGLGGDLDDL